MATTLVCLMIFVVFPVLMGIAIYRLGNDRPRPAR